MHNDIFVDTKKHILDNGLNLVSVKKETELFSIYIGIKSGALYEKNDEKGISHFIEHMLFKGTNTRSNEKLNSDLENLGGDYNAYTDYNCTVFNITALCSEIEASIEILSDMIINSNFPDEELKKERTVILAEIRTDNEDSENFTLKAINNIAFDKSPLKVDISGTESSVSHFSRKQIIEFYKEIYIPKNCYISIVSSFEHDKIAALVNKYFKGWQNREARSITITEEKNKKGISTIYKKHCELSSICYLYTYYNLSRFEELVLKIINHKFGAGINSMLFRELREKYGLAYDVYSDINLTNHVKTLYIYTGVENKNIHKSLEVINDCINRILNSSEIFDENTIRLMKKVMKTSVGGTLEASEELCSYVLHNFIEDEDIIQFVQNIKDIDKISAEDIKRVASKVFCDSTVLIINNGNEKE